MSDFESKIDINIDAGQALAAIKTLQRQISDFHTSLAKGSATANIKSLQMQQSLIDTINATGQYSAQMKTVASATQTFTTALEKNKLSMGQYFKYAGGASKSFGRFFKSEMDTVQKVAIERVKDLQTQYIKMGRDANGAIRSIAVRPLAIDMENLATKTQIAAQKQQLLNQLLKQGSTNLLNFGKNTQWAGRQLMVGFTIPLGIFGATAAKTFMQMEEQAIKFKRVYGDTFTATKETDAMLKQVQALASEFTKYGVTVEKTMEQAAKAAATGKMGADLLAQVSEATRLSVLGNVEQAQALETTISLTNAFGTAADELRGKINFLNAVENQTVTSIEDLTIAIPKAAPVIKQLGGGVEDLTFFLTAMREGGINASEGANALKSGLASLINPTKKASDFLQGFGININKIVEGNKGDVKGLVVDFAKALDTLDPLNRARAIEQLFGKFQFSRLSTLFQNVIKDGSQAAKVLELTRQSSAELGILAQRELNKISASPMYKFQKAIADFKKELAPVGEEFLKAVTPIIQFGTDILKAFNNLDGGVKQFIVNATGLVAGLGPIFLMTFGLIANGVANIIKGFTFVKTVFNKASSASTILGETTDYMTQQQIEAAAAAASLEQVHNKLTQAFTVETTAVGKLAAAYQKAVSAQNAFTGPPATGKPRRAKKYADGVFSVPGPKGAGDIVPAMLSPGEAVIPAKMASRYSGFINGMISGSIPGFKTGKPLAERLKVKGSSDAPGFISAQSRNFNWDSRNAEIQDVLAVAAQYGYNIDDVFKNNYLTTHASHLQPSFKQVNLGRGLMDKIKQWFAANLMPDLGIINKPLQDISDPNIAKLGKGSSKRKILEEFQKSIPQIAKELGISEKEVKRLGMQTLTGKHPRNKKSAAVASRIFGIAEGQAMDPAAKTRLGGARAVLARRTDPKNNFYATVNKRKYVDNETKRIEHENKILDKKKQVVKEATAAEVKALAARRQVAETQVKGAKQAKRAAVAQTATEKQKTRTAQTAKKLSKAEENRLKREAANKARSTSQTKVSATPKIRTTEELGDGLRRVVTTDSNGKQEERYYLKGRKGSVSAKDAQAMLAGRRGATTPGGKLKNFFSGTMGKLGMASMLASMGASAIPGVSGTGIDSTLSTLSYGLMGAEAAKGLFGGRQKFDAEGNPLPSRLDNIKKSETYKNISSKISGSKMAGRFGVATEALKTFKLEAAASVASKGLMKSMPMLAKGVSMLALRFFNVIPIIGQIALGLEIAYNVLTINAKKQEEISKAVIDTLTMTKEKLTGLNDFFGTEATLSGIRTAVPGLSTTPQGSLVKQFMDSEQFKNTYKEDAGKLRGATNEQFAITMQSLALDLYGQGMGEEQVQIIIDAIKTEAGKTDLVINFKDLKLDTESGMKNLGNSISKITDGAIREFKSNRDWLGINWEAQTKLDEFEAQVSGFISAISQEFQKGRISVQEFEAAFRNIELSAVKMNDANPGDGIAHLKDVLERTNPELARAAMLITDVTTYLNMMKAASLGVNLSENLLADLGRPEGSDARKNAEAYLKEASDYEKEKSKKIDKLNKKLAGINSQSQNLEKQEENINDLYDKRIKALERINQLQEQMSKQKQNQLDLADALSRGDVFAAAQAMQKIRADQAALALEQQKNALEDEKKKKIDSVQNKQDTVANGAKKIQDEISNVKEKKFDKPYETPTQSIRQMYESIKGYWNFMLGPRAMFMNEEDKYKEFTLLMNQFIDMRTAMGFQSGGYISGPGNGTSDSIPARLSNGEYVIRAKAVKALGTDVLDKMNHAEKFSEGGQVGSSGYIGPRPTPPFWDEDLRKYVVTQGSGDGFWQIAERYLPEGRTMDSWWREVIGANTNPETGKFPKLFGNSKVIIPGYVPPRDEHIYHQWMPNKARKNIDKHGGLPIGIGGYNRTGMGGLGLNRLFAEGGYASSDERRSSLKSREYNSWTPSKEQSLNVMADIKRLQEIDAQAKDSNPFNDASSDYRKQLLKNVAVYKSLYGDPTSSTLSVSQLRSQASSALTKQQLGVLANDTSGTMEAARFASYLTPVLGTGVAVSETANSASRGDVLGTALNALGVIPGIGGASKVIQKIGTKIGPSKFGNALTKTGSSGFNAYQAINNFVPNMLSKAGGKLKRTQLGANLENIGSMLFGKRVSPSMIEQQSKIAATTQQSFISAANKLKRAGGKQEYVDALIRYGQILAKNERYSFGNPGRLQSDNGLLRINDMTTKEIESLASGIISSNYGRNLVQESSSMISPYSVLTNNRNYRIQAPGRIQDFLYTRGLIGQPQGVGNLNDSLRQSGKYLFPATGPMPHIYGLGNRLPGGPAFVPGMETLTPYVPREGMYGIRGFLTASIRQAFMKPGHIGSSFSPEAGPLSVMMSPLAMNRKDHSVIAHEYQHVQDKFGLQVSGRYTGPVSINPLAEFAKSSAVNNAYFEAAARAKDSLITRGGYQRPYFTFGDDVTESMSPEEILDTVFGTMARRGQFGLFLPQGGRSHQFSPDWFNTYADEIANQRNILAQKFPDKAPIIHTDEQLRILKSIGAAMSKYGINSEDEYFTAAVHRFLNQRITESSYKYDLDSSEFQNIKQIYDNIVGTIEQSKGTTKQGYQQKIKQKLEKIIAGLFAKKSNKITKLGTDFKNKRPNPGILDSIKNKKDSKIKKGMPNYLDNTGIASAYINFMRTNPPIAVRMRSQQLIDKLAKKDFAYRNAFEEGMVVDDLDPRLEAENMLFGLGKDSPASSRPIYGAGVSPYTPWSIRGKASRNNNAFARWALRSKDSNINSTNFDQYGDISLLLKNRVKKRSTFTLGDSFGARERDSFLPTGPKKTVAAPYGTMSKSKILGAATNMMHPEFKFVEAQIFGGLPFSDIKKIVVKNPDLIPLLQQKIAEAGLKIPVGQTKLSLFGKLNEMYYKNKIHEPTGLSKFIPKFKTGGMFRTPYANGGLAMLHDKEFIMNAGAVKDYGVNNLRAMNNGTYTGGSVYNSYGVNINVGGSNNNANDIARTVIREIKRLDSQNIRSTKV